MYRIPILYLKWFLDNYHHEKIAIHEKYFDDDQKAERVSLIEYAQQKYKLIKEYTYPSFGQAKDFTREDWPFFPEAMFKKMK